MKLRKFFGLTSRSVLAQIRAELGPDAVIVANHPTAQGVEISAMASDAIDTILGEMPLAVRRSRARNAAPLPEPDSAPVEPDDNVAISTPQATPVAASKEAVPVHDDSANAAARDRMMQDMAAMRSLLESQVAQLAWSDSVRRRPLRAQLTQELMGFGYSPALVREITQHLPDDYTPAQAQQWLHGIIGRNIHCVAPEHDLIAAGGVYALVGPTGVGKTTTTAKLAARCAVRHGSASLALLTTDSYRVGAQDQLRIYAKILGVTVQAVNDADGLRQALESLRSKHLVLIDTVGMGQRDARVPEHALMLENPDVRRLLLLNASSQAETLDEVVTAYGGAKSLDRAIEDCIITKQDESARPGQVLDVIIRHQLRVHFVSNGQRVPEDLQPANAAYLAHRSFRQAPATSPFRLHRDDVPLILAGIGATHG